MEMKQMLNASRAGQTDGCGKGTEARAHHERGKALSKEKPQLKSGKAPRMCIISLSLKTSRVSQGLKEKAPTPYATIHGPLDEALQTFQNHLSLGVYYKNPNLAAQKKSGGESLIILQNKPERISQD